MNSDSRFQTLTLNRPNYVVPQTAISDSKLLHWTAKLCCCANSDSWMLETLILDSKLLTVILGKVPLTFLYFNLWHKFATRNVSTILKTRQSFLLNRTNRLSIVKFCTWECLWVHEILSWWIHQLRINVAVLSLFSWVNSTKIIGYRNHSMSLILLLFSK